MILQTVRGQVLLDPIPLDITPGPGGPVFRVANTGQDLPLVTRAAQSFLHQGRARTGASKVVAAGFEGGIPAAFRETQTGLLRVVYREVVVRFLAGTNKAAQEAVLKAQGLSVRRRNRLIPDQVIAYDESRNRQGAEIIEIANTLRDDTDVIFATPNFVSEYVRTATPAIPSAQWHLKNLGRQAGQLKGEDVKAAAAWKQMIGCEQVVIAVLDDGVDVDHPDLKPNIVPGLGRDFFVPDTDPEHHDPRPKSFQYPFNVMQGNDIHGTPCAGVAAAAGKGKGAAVGAAPRCRILPIKIFHADNLASDAQVADAIRYAALHSDVISCSWTGPVSDDVTLAIQDARLLNRKGNGTLVVCAVGNAYGKPVGFPASVPEAVAVGASTDQGRRADYSNTGPELWVVAPSSGGVTGVYTTDLSYPRRGFNLGTAAAGGKNGLYTNDFGGTSSATPLVAGVAALLRSVNPNLTAGQIKQILADTADKIDSGNTPYDPTTGRNDDYGHGRVNAQRAVAAAGPPPPPPPSPAPKRKGLKRPKKARRSKNS
jgi:subtilisin family serine protease